VRFICGLFYEYVSISDYTKSDERMTGEYYSGKNLEGSADGPNRDAMADILEGLRKIKKHFRQNSQCPGRDSNRAFPKYKSRTLPLF
jgi:hypothetical protein